MPIITRLILYVVGAGIVGFVAIFVAIAIQGPASDYLRRMEESVEEDFKRNREKYARGKARIRMAFRLALGSEEDIAKELESDSSARRGAGRHEDRD